LPTQTFKFYDKGLIFVQDRVYRGVIQEFGQVEEDEQIEGHLFLPLYHLFNVVSPS